MKSKRFIISIIALLINFILFSIAMKMGLDLTAVGTGLALLNAPLYGYIFGETKRKS
jgi:hypothetical protein